jgi:hypothetical protein
MASLSSRKRQRQLDELDASGIPALLPCEYCSLHDLSCIMPSEHSNSVRCQHCVRRGRPCVNASWESLDRTRERTRKQLDESFDAMTKQQEEIARRQEELNQVVAKISRLRKVLKLAEERATDKQRCLQEELFLEDQQNWQNEQSAILQADPSLPIGPLDSHSLAWLETVDWDATVPVREPSQAPGLASSSGETLQPASVTQNAH